MNISNWSNDSQVHTRICVLESQIDVRDNKIGILKAENLVLKVEITRLQEIIKNISQGE